MSFARALVVAALTLAGCAHDRVLGEDDGGVTIDAPAGPDADVGDDPCDMGGVWVAEQYTTSIAIGTDQNATNFYYFSIQDDGDRFTVVDSLNCGFVVDGLTTVSLSDGTLEALAAQEAAGPGRQGTFKPTADSTRCEFALDRMYNLRGANKATYLTDVWQVGDPALPLSSFPALPAAPPGMEDWDADGKDGITLSTGLGERYVAQRDWNEYAGTVPTWSAQFGGPDVVAVDWDSEEAISLQTPPVLRTTAEPSPPGWARFARAGGRLTVVTTGDHPTLETCRNVQQLAQEIWP